LNFKNFQIILPFLSRMKNFIKLILFLLAFGLVNHNLNAQCPFVGSLYGTAAAPSFSGQAVLALNAGSAACNYASASGDDYVSFTSLTAGNTYVVTSSASSTLPAVANTDELTVYLSTNTTTGNHVGFGTGGVVTFTAATSGTYFFIITPSGSACGTTQATCRYLSIQCTSCPAPPPPPANNECAGAVTLTPQSFASSCTSPVSATTANATQSNTNCSSTATNDDVWFVFTASATTQTVRFEGVTAVSGTVTSMGMDTYTTCGGTNSNCNTSITLTSGNGQANLTGLTIGTQYFLRVWTAGTSNSATFNICIISPPPPPANDDCTNAVTLVCGAGALSGTTVSSISEPALPGACASLFGVWYTFVGDNTLATITSTAGSGFDHEIDVFSGTCGALTNLSCTDAAGSAGTETVSFGTTSGTNYYIYIAYYSPTGTSSNTGTFNISRTCVPIPSNDNCAGATSLTTQPFAASCSSPVMGTTVGASTSNADCSSGQDDVWYSFTATATSEIVRFQSVTAVTGTVTAMGMNLYTGCPAVGPSNCNTTLTVTSGVAQGTLTGLTIGTTYYLRVWTSGTSNTGTFDICIIDPPPAPANDNCAGAISLTVNSDFACAVTTAGTTVSATQTTGETVPTCNGTGINDDVWFSFVATGTSHRIQTSSVSIGTSSMLLQVYGGTCGALTTAGLTGACGSFVDVINVSGLTAATTYYVRVATATSTATTTATFNICVGTPPPPPVNDNCSGAVSLTVNSDFACAVTTAGTTVSATQTSGETVPTCGASGINDDVWFSFVATGTSHRIQTSSVSIGTGGMQFQVYGGTCGALTTAGLTGACGTAVDVINVSGLTASTTYYVRVATSSTSTTTNATFNICVGTPPPPPANDNTAGAINIDQILSSTCSSALTGQTTESATQTIAPTVCATFTATAPVKDVWYKFIPQTPNPTINITATADVVLMLYLGDPTSGGTYVTCSDATGNNETLVTSNLTVGREYFFRVYPYLNTNSPTFSACVYGAVPASITLGTANTCVTARPSFSSGSGKTLYITNTDGGLVATLNDDAAMGNIDTKVYVRSGVARQDGNGVFYLNRNVAITPTTQPSSPVAVRIFYTNSELTNLQTSDPLATAANLNCTKISAACSGAAVDGGTFVAQSANGTGSGGNYAEFSFSSFSDIFLHRGASALPIELKSFTGKALKSSNQLKWITSTEEGVKEHIIERSANGYNNWTLVGTTPSKGDARVDQSYSIEDKTPLTKSFYRLRSLDLDGREQFSNVISLTRQNNSFGVIAAYPNPAVDMINVQFNTLEEGNITARIVDMTGRLVLEQQMSALNGTNMFPVQLHGLSAGTYFITLSSDREVAEPIRFVKQ
jgi:Secretion system C-terminal sorting domain